MNLYEPSSHISGGKAENGKDLIKKHKKEDVKLHPLFVFVGLTHNHFHNLIKCGVKERAVVIDKYIHRSYIFVVHT